MVNAAFDNWNNPEALQIEITASTINPEVPADYNPEALSTFTVVYGKELSSLDKIPSMCFEAGCQILTHICSSMS